MSLSTSLRACAPAAYFAELKEPWFFAVSFFFANVSNRSRGADERVSRSISAGKSSPRAFVAAVLFRMKIKVRIASASSPKFAKRIAASHSVRYSALDFFGGAGGFASSTGEIDIPLAADCERPAEMRAPAWAALRA